MTVTIDERVPLVTSRSDDLECYRGRKSTADDTKGRSRTRSSIFSNKSLSELEAAAGEKAVQLVTTTATGFFIQMILFFMLCLVIGLTPFFTQLLLRDPVTGKKSATFIPQMPYLVDFLMTVLISNVLSFVLYGREGLKACWDMKGILRLTPISLLYGTSQSLETVAMIYLDSAFRMILNQLKLPISAIMKRIFQGEKRTVVQWCLIAGTTTSIIGFVNSKLKGQTADIIANIAGLGLAIGCTAVTCSFFAQWMTDIKTKEMKQHLIIQMAQMRVTTAIVVLIYTISWALWNDELYKFPFYGWNMKVFGLSCFLVLKDLLTVYVLKRLNNIWLGLATSAGLGVAYIVDILFLSLPFDTTCLVFVVLVSILVVAWGAAKN